MDKITGKVEILFTDKGVQLEIHNLDAMEVLKAISILTSGAKENGLPASLILAATSLGVSGELKSISQENITLEKIADDTAISKEFADILRGLGKD